VIPTSPWRIQWIQSISQVPRQQWDRLAQPLQTPLLEWQWLHQLEVSGSIAPHQGWYPRHLTLWRDDRLVAAAALYLKTHSNGEFVFDQWGPAGPWKQASPIIPNWWA
jgi:predicted N-acyltransferase